MTSIKFSDMKNFPNLSSMVAQVPLAATFMSDRYLTVARMTVVRLSLFLRSNFSCSLVWLFSSFVVATFLYFHLSCATLYSNPPTTLTVYFTLLIIFFLPNILFSLNSPLGTSHWAYLAVWSLVKCYFIGSTSMEAIRKQASTLREQVAKRLQVYIKAFPAFSLTYVFRTLELCFFLDRFCLVRLWYWEEWKRRSRFLFLGICG